LTVHVSTQAAAELSRLIGRRFGLHPDRVRVVAEHVGGGFGAKLTLTPETVAAITLARAARAPVRVALDRHDEMSVGGYRPGAALDVAMLVSRTGSLRALQLHADGDAGIAVGSQIAMQARLLYPAEAKDLLDYDVVSHLPPGAPFRGPGGPLMAWALEQAVDEAAHRLGDDPIALRRRWDPHPQRQRLYAWAEQLELWRSRPETGRETGRLRRGVGVAAANWLYFFQTDCELEVGIENRRLYVATAVQDIGTGIRSVLAQTVAAAFGAQPADVDVRLGDTVLARGPTSGSSRTSATLVPAALLAAVRLQQRLARELGQRQELREAHCDDAGIHHAGGLIAWPDALASAPDMAERARRPADDPSRSSAPPPLAGTGLIGWANTLLFRLLLKLGIGRGYTGAVHVAEVEVDTALGRTRVLRVAGGLAAGRIASPALARSQCCGGIIQGVGYALYEQRVNDPHDGRVLTAGLEDYRIPGIADAPEIALHFEQFGFAHVAGGGVGLSELSTLAVAASIGNAVHNATGWRPYDLPIRPDRLLAGLAS
jgi:xanthine dehydrogenase YagR molybdenum-binding subunit